MFQCIQVNDTWFLVADLQLKCFTTEWTLHALIAASMLVLYTGEEGRIALRGWRTE